MVAGYSEFSDQNYLPDITPQFNDQRYFAAQLMLAKTPNKLIIGITMKLLWKCGFHPPAIKSQNSHQYIKTFKCSPAVTKSASYCDMFYFNFVFLVYKSHILVNMSQNLNYINKNAIQREEF